MRLNATELKDLVVKLTDSLTHCQLCAWKCGVDRTSGEMGQCGTGRRARVTSVFSHFGEEAPLRGTRGSGTIFFGNCNLQCRFCQNHDISQPETDGPAGREVTAEELAEMMLYLQRMGCHNLNLVTPSHVIVPIVEALSLAARQGLHIPLVYNTGGYDAVETIRSLEGLVDIFMPDMKYFDPRIARELSGPADYPQQNQATVTEMHRQVGDLELNEEGLAVQGLLVRHLVLPGGLAGTAHIARFLADLGRETYLNLMDQYRPHHRAHRQPPLDRRVTPQEWEQAVTQTKATGLWRLDHLLQDPKDPVV